MKEIIDEIMKIEGDVKGEVIRSDLEYIRRKEGEEVLKKIEDKLYELGYPLDFKKISPSGEYKEAYIVSVYVLLNELFSWTRDDIFKMGQGSAKISFIIKFLLKFVEFSRLMEEAPKYWSQHLNFGSIELEGNEKEKWVVIRIRGYKFHPLACAYQEGYLLAIVQLIVGGNSLKIKEQKCMHNGDPYHEHLITWE